MWIDCDEFGGDRNWFLSKQKNEKKTESIVNIVNIPVNVICVNVIYSVHVLNCLIDVTRYSSLE